MDTLTATDLPASRGPRPGILGVALRVFAGVAAGLLVAALVVALVSTQFLGYRALAIASDSMGPAIHPGDLVLTRPVSIETVNQGDVVAYDEGDVVHVTVVHRVVGVINVKVNTTDSQTGSTTTQTTRILRTQGDANPTADAGSVGADRFRGIVFATVPVAGSLLASGAAQQVLVGLAVLIGVVWLLYEIVLYRRRGTPPI